MSNLSRFGVTPVTSQEVWSSVVSQLPTPSISITVAPAQRSNVNRTSWERQNTPPHTHSLWITEACSSLNVKFQFPLTMNSFSFHQASLQWRPLNYRLTIMTTGQTLKLRQIWITKEPWIYTRLLFIFTSGNGFIKMQLEMSSNSHLHLQSCCLSVSISYRTIKLRACHTDMQYSPTATGMLTLCFWYKVSII